MSDQPTGPNPRFYVTVAEAARLLNIKRQSVMQAIKENRIRAIRFGMAQSRAAFYLIRKDDVKRYQQERELRRKLQSNETGAAT